MAIQVQLRRGTSTQHNSFTGAIAELTFDSTNTALRIHDGSKIGGHLLPKSSDLTTANVTELTNLYYTVGRANTAIDNRVTKSFVDNLNVDADTLDGLDSSAFALDTDLTTANVAELTNLYFTNARVYANVTQIGFATNSNLLLKANITDLTTSNIGELTNLYYTVGRANTAIDNRVTKSFVDNLGINATTLDGINSSAFALDSDLTTANVIETTNLYFTFARARAALVSNAISVGELSVTGNLFVQGNTTTLNTATLTIEDKNIVLANGAASAAAADGAGLTVNGANANIVYLNSTESWSFNKNISLGGNVSSGNVSVTGTIFSQGNISSDAYITSPFFYSESDIALKENVQPIENALHKVLNMFGVSFQWKLNKTKSLGVIAQEVERVVPEIVSSANGHKTVSYDSIIPLLIEAIKDQQSQIDQLKKRLK
jgi:hypothetical protein